MKAIFFFIVFCSLTASAAPEKAHDRWGELMKLVSQEMRILENARRKGPELLYRLLELHSEKLKLIHEKNNREFLLKSRASSTPLKKEDFFKETALYYQKTKEFGFKILKDFPATNRRPEILFALALNSRDYGKDQIAERYLLETISLVKDPHHSLRHHAETALADFYYNEKRFQEAITYYVRAIQKTEDEWLTKHLFNLSWCYLKVREFDKAISTIKDSYFKSKDRVYVNIRDQVLENIGSFYVYAGRPLEGLEFYLENEKDPVPYLLPMSVKTSEKGHEKETEEILEAAQKLVDKNGWVQYQEEIFHTSLDFYRHYNRFADHERSSAKLVAYYQKPNVPVKMREEAIEKMRSLAGFLQVKLARDMKEDRGEYEEKELNIVLRFFEHLMVLDVPKRAEYFYFRGETHYSVRRFEDAALAYQHSIEECRKIKDMVLAKKALTSLLALTGQEVMGKDLNKQYLVYAYTEHIKLMPRDERSEQIYPKLFEIFRLDGDDRKATGVLRAFHQAYPEHLADQQTLMTKVLDLMIEKKETKKLAFWINQFKSGFLSFSKDMIEKTEITLGNILFLQYQDMAKKGEKLAAAKGFESIYVNKLYSDKVKWQSAFFAALAYLEMSETEKSFYWLTLAHGRMSEAEKKEKREEELKMAERMYRLQDFKTSTQLSSLLLGEFCSLKDDTQDRLFEVAVMTSLVEEKSNEAEDLMKNRASCLKSPEVKTKAAWQIYQFLEKKGDFFGLRKFVRRNSTDDLKSAYRLSLQKWYWERSDLTLKGHILQEFKDLRDAETQGWLKEIDLYQAAKVMKEELEKTTIWEEKVFHGERFNQALENHLLKYTQFKNRFQGLNQSTQVDLAVLSTRLFADAYQELGKKIQGLRPSDMSAEVYKDFGPAMKGLGSQFLALSSQYRKELEKAIKGKEKLTFGTRAIAAVEEIENPVFSFFTGITMDKNKE